MMIWAARVILTGIFLFLTACAEDSPVYAFPSLSVGKLVDLKKASEKLEGFFLTTALSDSVLATGSAGLSIYVCVRFLNDPAVNAKIKQSAIPLLVQAGTLPNAPEAEAVLLFHPETEEMFYYEEGRRFQFASMALVWGNQEYEIMDYHFNENGRVRDIYFKPKGVSEERIHGIRGREDQYIISPEEAKQMERQDKDSARLMILKLSSFARLVNQSCSNWPLLRYSHSPGVPDYLHINYGGQEKSGSGQASPPAGNAVGSTTAGLPPMTKPPKPIKIDAPYVPVPKNTD